MSGRTYHCDGPSCDEQSSRLPLSVGTNCFTQQHTTYRFCSFGCLALWAADRFSGGVSDRPVRLSSTGEDDLGKGGRT
jgi:hypothetical protein